MTSSRYRNISHVMRKPTFCIWERKDGDQLRSNRGANQRLCFRYKDGTIPQLSKSEISRLYPYSFAASSVCAWSATRTLDFSSLYSAKKGKQEPRDHHQTQHSPNSLALFATDSLELKLAHTSINEHKNTHKRPIFRI